MSSSSSSTLSVSNSDDKSPKSVSPDGGAQRFFSQGKRIPKDVKRHCGMCKQHGVIVETRGHTCEFKNCNCEHCDLVRKRREIMSTQIRLRREQDKKFQRTTDINEANVFPGCTGEPDEKTLESMNMCYFCQKCKNHSVLVWKKNHKKDCQFATCDCEQCSLIDSRRALDRHIKKRRMSIKSAEKSVSAPKSPKKEAGSSSSSLASSASDESASSSDCSLSGMLSEKLNVAVFSETTSPIPPFLPHTPPSLVLPLSTVPSTVPLSFLNLPNLITTTCAPSFFTPSLVYGTPNLMPNPFLIPFPPFDMQLLFQNLQNLNELSSMVEKN